MREIAEAAGLRKATIYHHFRDKEELFIAVTLQGMAELQAAMRASVFGKTGLPARLEELAFTQLSMSRGTGMRLAQDFRDHIPESRHAEMHAALEEVLALYRSVFEDAAAAGELADIDPALAASSFFHIMISWMWDFPGPTPPSSRIRARWPRRRSDCCSTGWPAQISAPARNVFITPSSTVSETGSVLV